MDDLNLAVVKSISSSSPWYIAFILAIELFAQLAQSPNYNATLKQNFPNIQQIDFEYANCNISSPLLFGACEFAYVARGKQGSGSDP
ncbi:hypothetical protein GOBAR_DD35662 [Gossypium barbadense]|nr:hypothetical protein GOBAR_DD35662 [Gossypium barbadense]